MRYDLKGRAESDHRACCPDLYDLGERRIDNTLLSRLFPTLTEGVAIFACYTPSTTDRMQAEE
jgi:hypothetical protein